MIGPFDAKIANYFKKKLEKYILWRIKPINQEEVNDIEWQNHFIDGNDSFELVFENEHKIKLYKDSILCRSIYFSFEESEIIFVKRFLKKGDVFIDVGANIGLFTLHASGIVGDEGNVISFEPTPKTYTRLLENIQLNHLLNVKTENMGLSDKEATLNFNVSNSGYDAWNSFAKLDELSNSETINVSVITLDNYIKENLHTKIDLVKIDVEGWELFVLKGAHELLSKSDAPVLLIEFTETNAFAAGYYCGEVYEFIKKYNYEWYSYDKYLNKLIPQQKKLHYPYENLIAVKNLENARNRLENQS